MNKLPDDVLKYLIKSFIWDIADFTRIPLVSKRLAEIFRDDVLRSVINERCVSFGFKVNLFTSPVIRRYNGRKTLKMIYHPGYYEIKKYKEEFRVGYAEEKDIDMAFNNILPISLSINLYPFVLGEFKKGLFECDFHIDRAKIKIYYDGTCINYLVRCDNRLVDSNQRVRGKTFTINTLTNRLNEYYQLNDALQHHGLRMKYNPIFNRYDLAYYFNGRRIDLP